MSWYISKKRINLFGPTRKILFDMVIDFDREEGKKNTNSIPYAEIIQNICKYQYFNNFNFLDGQQILLLDGQHWRVLY